MSKLTFLGSGSAFTIGADNYQSNMILQADNGDRLLIDCGTDIRFSLAEQNLSYKDIDAIYISHLHADHIGGLEYLGFCTYFDPDCDRPDLYISSELAYQLWENCLAGGMRSLNGKIASLETYFNVCFLNPLEFEWSFTWNNFSYKLIDTLHVDNGIFVIPSYGLYFETPKKDFIFISTDTQFYPELLRHYDSSDLIFQDCETACTSDVHVHYPRLAELSQEYKQKMWLYGQNPGELPDAKGDRFLGFVKKGQVFDLK